MCMRLVRIVIGLLISVLCCACYNHGQKTPDAWDLSKQQIDSISFSTTHHYTQNYNFLVRSELLPLADNMGDMAFDTMYVTKGQRIVVADIETIPTDTIDSVWVKVARDQITQGWIRESELLNAVSPDDPISQFIDVFSDTHLLVFLAFCVIVGGAYAMRKLLRHAAVYSYGLLRHSLCHHSDFRSRAVATLLFPSFAQSLQPSLYPWSFRQFRMGNHHRWCGCCRRYYTSSSGL